MDPIAPEFQYEMRLLPRGRFTFRRWRYELWHGATLRASGWRTSPRAAERALMALDARTLRDIGIESYQPGLAERIQESRHHDALRLRATLLDQL